MLDQVTVDALQSINIDVDKLSTALSSEEEVSLDIKLPKGYSEEEFQAVSKNRFDEGKKALEEIKAKALKKEFGIELDSKNLSEVFQAYGDKLKTEIGNSSAEEDLKALREQLITVERDRDNIVASAKKDAFNTTLKASLLSLMPEMETALKDELVGLYLNRTKVVDAEGQAQIEVGGEIKKDHTRQPITVEADFKEYLDTSPIVKLSTPTTKDSQGGKTNPKDTKFSNSTEFVAWCEEAGKNPMSTEMQRFYAENKS
jgi:hypothetical protein